MSGGAINYAAAVDSLKQMERRVPGTVSFGVRLPAEAAMAIDFLAEQSETNRNSIVRQALIRYLETFYYERDACGTEQKNAHP